MRTYDFPDCAPLPSVTTIIGELWPKPSLLRWQLGEVADYALTHWGQPIPTRDNLIAAATAKRDAASLRGRKVHSVMEALALDLPVPDVPEAQQGYVDAGRAFVAEYEPRWIASEMIVRCSDLFAGTLDAIVEIERSLVLIDWKTSAGIYEEAGVQVGGYSSCDLCQPVRPGPVLPITEPLDGRLPEMGAVVRLGKDGSHEVAWVDLDIARRKWSSLFAFWLEQHAETCLMDNERTAQCSPSI